MNTHQKLTDLLEYGRIIDRPTVFPIKSFNGNRQIVFDDMLAKIYRSKHNKAAALRFKARHKKRKK